MCVLVLCGIAGFMLQTAPMPLLCVFLCARLWKLHGLVLGAVVWEDVWEETLARAPSNHVTSHRRALRLRLRLCVRMATYPSQCFPTRTFARTHYCIRSLLWKISKSPGAKDTVRAFTLLLNRFTVKEIKRSHSVRRTVNGHYPQPWLSHQLHRDLRRY